MNKSEGESLGLNNIQISRRIAENLAIIAKDICEQIPAISGLLLTGGDIAKSVCSQLGVSEVELLSEVEPGLPLGKLNGSTKDMLAITKAGGFGHQQSIIRALNYLTEGG